MKNQLIKKRKVYDEPETSIIEIIQHCVVNFFYGLFSGLTIAAVALGNMYLIIVAYYMLKQVEGKILNRNKYTSKLGKNIIFPLPSTLGFVLGWKISTYI